MSVKSDNWILKMCEEEELITPFSKGLSQKGKISYGLSSCGYDVRLSKEFKSLINDSLLDPKAMSNDNYVIEEAYPLTSGLVFDLEPHSIVLGRTIEYIKMPKNVMAYVITKSTYARCGIMMPPTILEPGWEGTITLEIINNTDCIVELYAEEGIAQIVFVELDERPITSYDERDGKYMFQQDVTISRIKE